MSGLDETRLATQLEAIEVVGPLDAVAMAEATATLDSLTKPPGSLGFLESLITQLAGITGTPRPMFPLRGIVVAAADHGVASHGVSAYPSAVTGQMVANFLAGGAAINVLAAAVRADVTVIDVGVASDIPAPTRTDKDTPSGGRPAAIVRASVRPGTHDMTVRPAMSREEALRAIAVGLDVVASLREKGIDLLAVGEMGIGNTTAASAITSAMTGLPPDRVTGRGTGIDDDARARKVQTIAMALARHRPDPTDPIGVLTAVGGLEIGALVGVLLGAVAGRVPVVLDGFITGAAALLAVALAPAVAPRLIAGHRGAEPGHAIVLERLGLRPLLELDLRLGEGTGAALAIQVIDAAVALRDGMATFASAGVSGRAVGQVPTT
jgi:nicotinate-nucleotide--dimethylbenzimidazole phosphoribosyltransferase